MAARKRRGERFVSLPLRLVYDPAFASLSGNEVKLLLDIYKQYNGKNNGNLTATFSVLSKPEYGWEGRKRTAERALAGLKEKGFVVVTRQGMLLKGLSTLLAVTWRGIDDCGVVYDPGIKPSPVPLRKWECTKSDQ